VQLLLGAGVAVAAVRGHRAHDAGERGVDAADCRGDERRVGRIAQVHAVVERDPVRVVAD
jgi:hypothetical protein